MPYKDKNKQLAYMRAHQRSPNKKKARLQAVLKYQNGTGKEKRRLANKKYQQSEKGKLSQTRYAISGKQKNAVLKKKYGITLDQYKILLAVQNNVCAICKQQNSYIDSRTQQIQSLVVDHEHKTGRVRGLLCGNCNRALGLLKDNLDIVHNMQNYLKQ